MSRCLAGPETMHGRIETSANLAFSGLPSPVARTLPTLTGTAETKPQSTQHCRIGDKATQEMERLTERKETHVFPLSSRRVISACSINSSLRCSADRGSVCSLGGGEGGTAEVAERALSAFSFAVI